MELSCKVQISRRDGKAKLRGQDCIALRNNSRTPQHLKTSITKGKSYDDGYEITRDKGLSIYFRMQGLALDVQRIFRRCDVEPIPTSAQFSRISWNQLQKVKARSAKVKPLH